MSLLYYDQPELRKKSLPVDQITDEIRQFAKEMIEMMVHFNGVGLAAPQVDRLIRLIVIRDEFIDAEEQYRLGPPEVLINPVLSRPSKETDSMPEGCLSIPGIHAEVVRPLSIHVRYQTLDDQTVEEDVIGFRARVIMHENDHLNGTLYIDRLSSEEREKIEPLLREIKEKYHRS